MAFLAAYAPHALVISGVIKASVVVLLGPRAGLPDWVVGTGAALWIACTAAAAWLLAKRRKAASAGGAPA